MADGAITYQPSSWQALYHSRLEDQVLGAGSAGPGKTLCLIMDPMEQVNLEHNRCLQKNHPYPLRWGHSVGWALHLRREFPMLKHTIDRCHRIFPQIDPDVSWNAQDHTFTFRSGYKFQFGHCRNPEDWSGYQSTEFTHIAFDELVQFDEEQFEQIDTRKRTVDPVLRHLLKTRAMSNPVMTRDSNFNIAIKNPHWVRDRFVKPHREGGMVLKKLLRRADGSTFERTRLYLPATLYHNPNKDFVAQYEESLLDRPPHIRAALLYGDWFVVPGSFFGEDWNQQLHVCRPFNIPDSWPRFRAMDWGYKSQGVVGWFAMDEDSNLFMEREFNFKNMSATEVAKRIKEIESDPKVGLWAGKKSGITGPADTQLWEERGESGKSKAAEMADVGVEWTKADKRSRAHGAQLLLARIKDHQGGTTRPGFVAFSSCVQTIQTVPGIQADKDDPECPADGGDDHWLDVVMYAAKHASRGRAGIARRRTSRDVERDELEKDNVIPMRGRYGYGEGV